MKKHKPSQRYSLGKVEERLKANPEKLWSLSEMERTEGEPDVVAQDKKTGAYIFMIAHRRALKDEEVFATTVRRGNQERRINRQLMR